jgi:hypothetical protein
LPKTLGVPCALVERRGQTSRLLVFPDFAAFGFQVFQEPSHKLQSFGLSAAWHRQLHMVYLRYLHEPFPNAIEVSRYQAYVCKAVEGSRRTRNILCHRTEFSGIAFSYMNQLILIVS